MKRYPQSTEIFHNLNFGGWLEEQLRSGWHCKDSLLLCKPQWFPPRLRACRSRRATYATEKVIDLPFVGLWYMSSGSEAAGSLHESPSFCSACFGSIFKRSLAGSLRLGCTTPLFQKATSSSPSSSEYGGISRRMKSASKHGGAGGRLQSTLTQRIK